MKPFLFLGTRAQDLAADGEYDAVLRFTGLDERDVRRVRLERDELGEVDLDAWSGIVLGGGPFNISDPEDAKSGTQRRVEAELRALAERVLERDSPFLGACYGIGTLGTLRGGVVDRTYAEPIGAVTVTLTDAGREDPLTGVLPETFEAFLGHQEAVSRLPRGAVLLGEGAGCPVQAFRLGRNVYATQFHPELDVEGIVTRIHVYAGYGYFEPADEQVLVDGARAATVTEPPHLLRRFVELFADY
ncbi:glutamine amidotransferase [Nocardioides lianchengensis]|uniref:GMP synthase (Glutamine-hydrolysing) n=1 Tax=Nocardioides lianchengensis TaxID=1045774 RepID=A0A1G6L581_9ACTN|nr:glutamine amidotransferase [Nocardioides lianchengensis]NYG12680.1 GMP synthase (glutamine-hydrolyzing) [Nocardioides lianchengensis]SDC38374.1 GMP synthase (glutamine-hydrolysing) [Nocardioides lianchengensis]